MGAHFYKERWSNFPDGIIASILSFLRHSVSKLLTLSGIV